MSFMGAIDLNASLSRLSVEDRVRLLQLLREERTRDARRKIRSYFRRMTGLSIPAHMGKVFDLIQAMEEDKVDRAMVFMPPRHGKTTICSRIAPAWIMGRNPKESVMAATHSTPLAGVNGRLVRNQFKSALFPFADVYLASDAQDKKSWETSRGGAYNAFGMDSAPHGFPADWLIMDDLFKGRKEALSETARSRVWESYQVDLLSRLEGRRKQLMLFTRWHEEDPAGMILPKDYDGSSGWFRDRITGELWYVLSLQAICETDNDLMGRGRGEWLWAEKFGEKQLGAIKRRGGWQWSALYQQRPTPEDGLYFTQDMIRYYDPKSIDTSTMTIYAASDYATAGEAGANDPDYTVHMIFGVCPRKNVYILDIWREQTTSDVWVKNAIRLMHKWKPVTWAEENGQIIQGVGPFLEMAMMEESAFCHRKQFTSSTSKEQRSSSALGLMSAGRVFIPNDHMHRDDLEKELLAFPGGKHDDLVDALTLFCRLLSYIVSGKKPKSESDPPPGTLDALLKEHDETMGVET